MSIAIESSPREIPGVLRKLLQAGEAVSNDLLDLWLAVSNGERPGFCVSTYYKLRRMLPHHRLELDALREWLEGRIEVRAWVREQKKMDQLPLDLACAHELEDYCQHKMREAYRSGRYSGGELEMTFGYRAA